MRPIFSRPQRILPNPSRDLQGSTTRPPYHPGNVESREPDVPSERISSRVAGISESSTLAIDARAKALKAAGVNVIGFGAGEPDFSTPDHIVAAAVEAARHAPYHHYTPAAGLPELRAAIASKTQRDS